MAAASLQERIRKALAEPTASQKVASLIIEVEAAEREAQKALEDANRRALDPSLSEAAASVAQQGAVQREFARNRLGAALVSLTKREAEMKRLEAEVEPIRAAAIAARDALAAELAEKWPKLTDELVDLIRRIEENDRLIQPFHLESAEAVARGCSSNFSVGVTLVPRCTHARIPDLKGTGYAWPPASLRLVG